VSNAKASRRRLAACCQGSTGPVLSALVAAAVFRLVSWFIESSNAVPMLFQNPRQGRGVMEPRCSGGAVTALG
jgi:hypothetical protein